MSRDWKPGELALVECSDGELRRAMFSTHSVDRHTKFWAFSDGLRRTPDSMARPLVVVDPEKVPHLREFSTDPRQALLTLAQDVFEADQHFSCDLDAAAAVLRWLAEQMPLPPKPDEPTSPLAIVEDASGLRWYRMPEKRVPDHLWAAFDDRADYDRDWSDIDAVRVVSEGVQP